MPTLNFLISELFRYDALVAALASLLTCFALVLTKSWHGSFSMDWTSGVQKMHTKPTPRIGGIAIAVGVLAGYAASSHGQAAAEKRAILSAILLAGLPAFIFGLLEDVTKKVSVKVRLLATMASGVLGWGITGTSLTHVDIPGIDWLLSFTLISVLFTAFAVGGVANAINIIDGFNGLTAGTALIMLTAFGLIARQVGDIPLAFTSLIIAGAVLGFFLVNWPRGKIFLGDGGAYFLGFTLAWIAVLLPERNAAVSPWSSLLICSYPIIEVAFSIFRRKFLREGYPATQPDAVHLHTLANKRWAKKIFSNSSKTTQNGLTSPFLWVYALLPCSAAIVFYDSKIFTLLSLIVSISAYLLMYSKLAFFRWIPKK
ncbi:MraY family glycosyltransferase [Comamonas composti]|uniref:MraY family glycosyltransferase n=1 Tax=Comamonas composti TaxID=408558 RepID=UPI00042555C2|nr:glycosyltransferase [Comamonas composti]